MAAGTVGVLRAVLAADNAQFNAAFAESSQKASLFAVNLTKVGATAEQMGAAFTNSLARSLSAVQAFTKEFSGATVAKQADEMAAAIGRLPGVSSLTRQEQAKVNAVMAEAIAKYQALGQTAPANLVALEQATRKASATTETFGSTLKASFTNLGPSIAASAAGFATGLISVHALEAGFHELTAFVGDCIEAFQKQEVASKHVEAALRSNGTFTPTLARQYDELATRFEKTTVNADELNSEAIAMFTSLGQVGPAQMEKALQGASDLAAGLGIDLMSAVELISKGMTGSSERLKKLTGDFDDSADKGKKLDNILGAIAGRFSGRAAAETETYSGQIAKLANQWDNLKEKIGEAIAKSETVQGGLALTTKAVESQLTATKSSGDSWFQWGAAIKQAFEEVLPQARILGSALDLLRSAAPTPAKAPGKDINLPVVDNSSALDKLKRQTDKVTAAIKELDQATKNQIISSDAAGFSAKDISEKLVVEEKVVKGVLEAHKSAAEAAKKAADETKRYAQEIQGLAEQFTGAKIQVEIDKISAAVTKAGGAEKISTAEGEKLVKQLQEMQTAGGRLDPVLQNVISRFQTFATAGIKVQSGVGSIIKWMPDVTKAIQDDQKAIDKEQQSWDKMLQTLPGLPAGFLKITAVDIKKWGTDGADGTKALEEALSSLSGSFAQMAQISGGSFGGVTKGIGEAMGAMNIFVKGQAAVTKGFADMAKGSSASAAEIVAGATNMVSAMFLVGQTILKAWKKQDAAEELIRQLKAAHNLALEFASDSTLSTGLEVGIEASRKALENLMPQGTAYERLLTRLAAESLHLTEIMDDLGGISATSLETIEDRAGRLFDLIKLGGATGAAAVKELSAVLTRMGDYFAANGGLWDDTFKALVARAKELGVNIEGLNSLLAGQQAKIVSGSNGVTASIGAQAAKYAELKKAVQDATDAGDNDKLIAAQKALSGAVVVSQGEFDRLSRISLSAFNTLVASGVDAVTAMGQVGPGIDNLIASAKAFGLSGNDAFNQLSRWRDLTTANAPLLAQIGNLNDLMVASANLGSLTADGFADLQAQGVSAFQQLTAAGLTQQEAETSMKPLLESIIKLHKDKGLAIDDATQAIIDQAKADGVLGKQEESTQQVLKEGLSALLTGLKIALPEAWKETADAAKNAAEETQKAWDGVNINPIPVEFNYRTTGTKPDFSTPDNGGGDQADQPPGFASGTQGKFIDFGKGTLAVLHGWEKVVTKDEESKYRWPAAPAMTMPQFGGSYLPTGPAMESATAVVDTSAQRPIVVKTYLGPRQIAESVTREQPGVLRRRGWTLGR